MTHYQDIPTGASAVPPPNGEPVYADASYGAQAAYGQDFYPYQQTAYGQPYYGDPAYGYYGQPFQQPAPPQQKRGLSGGAIVGIVVIIAIALVLVVSMVSCSAVFGSLAGSIGSVSSTGQGLPSDDSPKIGVIDIDGTIQYDGSSSSPSGLRTLLDQAEGDDSIKAVVLRVNSGGGVATAGEEMAYYLREFSKPVVVSSASSNASAAYEISSQADYIFTAKTTSIGAIGVAFQVTDLSGLYDKLGINIESITSADAKDATYGDRPLTEEERAWYQAIVDQIDDDFVMTVAEGRKMDVSEVRELANGLPYTGIDAVECGLADEVGYYEDAIAKACELAGYDEELDTYPLSVYSSSNLSMLLDVLGQQKADAAALDALGAKYGLFSENG